VGCQTSKLIGRGGSERDEEVAMGESNDDFENDVHVHFEDDIYTELIPLAHFLFYERMVTRAEQ
jgi:hypothetical protein